MKNRGKKNPLQILLLVLKVIPISGLDYFKERKTPVKLLGDFLKFLKISPFATKKKCQILSFYIYFPAKKSK